MSEEQIDDLILKGLCLVMLVAALAWWWKG